MNDVTYQLNILGLIAKTIEIILYFILSGNYNVF